MKKLTAEWVRKADVDLAAAIRLLQERPRLNDPACFHCQQAIEKYLKALLQEIGLPIPRTHDLDDLLNRVVPQHSTLACFRTVLNRMTQYAVDYRYPGKHATSRQAQTAFQIASRIREEIRKRLRIRSRSRRPKRKRP